MWAEDIYTSSSITFDGTNCEDTGMNLYSSDNVDKNYEISFEIAKNGSNSNQATLMNAMYEVNPWPGVLVRAINNNSAFEVDMNGGSGSFKKNFNISETSKITIKRVNGIIYIRANDDEFIQTKDHSSITTFDIPVTFGCSLQAGKTPQRYYKGTLQNMKVILFE